MENNIILSICIPTYNRSCLLETTVLSIVSQKRFQQTNDVEIIISDNCSDDDTKEISIALTKLYGEKIRYYRNDDNIQDLNFEKALSYGLGLFLKLNNDTLKHQEGSLNKILQVIEENIDERNILFFSNGVTRHSENMICHNLNSFIDTVSYWSGWIGAFGIWREDFIHFDNFNKYSHLKLTQVYVLFNLINSQRSVLVYIEKLFISLPPSKKGGYDLLTVFLDNYVFLLNEQLDERKITKKIFLLEKRKLLHQFILPWLINLKTNPEEYYFTYKNRFSRIIKSYRRDFVTLVIFFIRYSILLFYNHIKRNLLL